MIGLLFAVMAKKRSTRHKENSPPVVRAPRSRLHNLSPSSAHMAQAARELHDRLSRIVASFDRGRAEGTSDATTWSQWKFGERSPSRQTLSRKPGIVLALTAYAERSIIDERRQKVGMTLGFVAWRICCGELSPDKGIRAAKKARADKGIGDNALEEIRRTLERRRSTPASRWRAVYNTLAFDGDVYPRPDTRGGLRGELESLFHFVSQKPQTILVEDAEHIRDRDSDR